MRIIDQNIYVFHRLCCFSVKQAFFLLIVLATCAAAFSNKITLELKTELKLNRLLEFYLHCSSKKGITELWQESCVYEYAYLLQNTAGRSSISSAQMQIQVKGLAWMRPENNEAFPHLLPFNSIQALISSNPFQKTEMYKFSFEISWHSKSFRCLAPHENYPFYSYVACYRQPLE